MQRPPPPYRVSTHLCLPVLFGRRVALESEKHELNLVSLKHMKLALVEFPLSRYKHFSVSILLPNLTFSIIIAITEGLYFPR